MEKRAYYALHKLKKILFFFIIILAHHSLFAASLDSLKISQKNKTIFFVSEGTIFHGTVYITNNAGKEKGKTTIHKTKWKGKSKSRGISEQVKLKKSRDAQLIQDIQNHINSRKAYHYHQSSDQQLTLSNPCQYNVSTSSANANPVFLSHSYYLTVLKIQVQKQRFYSSVSFVLFCRLLDSFLRGPPLLCYNRSIFKSAKG